MDDKDNKPPRGRKPGGQRSSNAGFSGPRPSGAGKGGKPPFGGGKKPFGKPRAAAGGADGDFKRDRKPYKPREDRGGEAGDRPQRTFGGDRSFRKSGAADGGSDARPSRKPYQKREGNDRRPEAGDKPYRAREGGKPYEKRDEARRPYEKRDEARKPFRPRGDRPEGGQTGGGFRGERKPFEKTQGDRPGRFERQAARGDADAARSERPQRSYSDGPRPPRKPYDKPAGGERGDRSEKPRRDFADRKPGGFKPRPRSEEAAAESGERIAKRLARAGIASRRDAEELIAAGRVKVNGKVVETPAFNVAASDVIHLDGTEIPPVERTRLFLFHKPAGVVTTNRDPEGRKTVFDVLPAELPRLMTVGRLDINTEGLLLLTNDGGLSRVLELPATGWLRRYRVRVHGTVEESALAGLKDGIAVDGVFYGAVEASLERTQGTNAWLTIGLREGKNREVKNILGALGLEVTRLIRVSYGPFQLGELPEGHVLEIKGRTLREQLGERLVEESGANFEADVLKPFSNRPMRRTEPRPEQPERQRPLRDGNRQPIGEGGLIKARKRRENSRDEALGKLSTRPERSGFGSKSDFGGRPGRDFSDKPDRGPDRSPARRPARGGKKFERDERPLEPPGQRRANVWMAPGARPQSKKAEGEDSGKPRNARPPRSGSGGDRPRPKPGGPKKR
ncbi:MAG: pseudouridine synthase [Mesorhizobium sp.]|nr:pseudouridine synthase [Mesorhizobium sp.]MBN9241463.1 pseudouridine synthase [Mesorhizobium sp.]